MGSDWQWRGLGLEAVEFDKPVRAMVAIELVLREGLFPATLGPGIRHTGGS